MRVSTRSSACGTASRTSADMGWQKSVCPASRIADNALFPDLFPTCLELWFDQTNHLPAAF